MELTFSFYLNLICLKIEFNNEHVPIKNLYLYHKTTDTKMKNTYNFGTKLKNKIGLLER